MLGFASVLFSTGVVSDLLLGGGTDKFFSLGGKNTYPFDSSSAFRSSDETPFEGEISILLLSFFGSGGYLTNPSSAVAKGDRFNIKMAKSVPVNLVTYFEKQHRLVEKTKLSLAGRKNPVQNRHFFYKV
jgi:hypothetical protein